MVATWGAYTRIGTAGPSCGGFGRSRSTSTRHHRKRARGEPGRGQGAIPGELGKVPHQPTGACLTRTKAKTKAPPLRSWAVTLTVGSHSFSLRNPSLKASRTP